MRQNATVLEQSLEPSLCGSSRAFARLRKETNVLCVCARVNCIIDIVICICVCIHVYIYIICIIMYLYSIYNTV